MRPPLLDHVSPAEDGVCHPPAQWSQAQLPHATAPEESCLRIPSVRACSDAIPDELAVVWEWTLPSDTPAFAHRLACPL